MGKDDNVKGGQDVHDKAERDNDWIEKSIELVFTVKPP